MLLFHQIAWCCRLGLQKRKASIFQKSFRHKVFVKKVDQWGAWITFILSPFYDLLGLWKRMIQRTILRESFIHFVELLKKVLLGNSSPKKVVSSLKDIVPKPFLSFFTFKNHSFLKRVHISSASKFANTQCYILRYFNYQNYLSKLSIYYVFYVP